MSDLRSDTRVTVTVGDLEIESTERIVVRVERVCGGIVGLAFEATGIHRCPVTGRHMETGSAVRARRAWSLILLRGL